MVFVVPAKVSIRNIGDIFSDLLNHVKNGSPVEIDADGCEEMDLSLLQLIESARKSAAANRQQIRLTRPANDKLRATLERAGLVAGFSADDKRFWFHEGV